MKHYVVGWMSKKILDNNMSKSGKAFVLGVDRNGFGKYDYCWFPVSHCAFSEPNECGNITVMIPTWLVDKHTREYGRLHMENVHVEHK